MSTEFAHRAFTPGRELRAAWEHFEHPPAPDGDDYNRLMLVGVSKYIALQVSSLTIGYVTQLLVARWLGSTDYGFYSLSMTVAVILAHIATFGFPTALDRFLPQYAEDGDWHLYRGLLQRSLLLTVAFGAVIFLLAQPGIYFTNLPSIEKICLVIGMALVPVLGASDLLSGALQSLNRIVAAYFPDEVVAPLGFLGTIAAMQLLLGDLDAIHMLIAMLAAQTVAVVIQAGWLRVALPGDFLQARPEYKVGKWLRTALPVLFITMFGILVYRADLLLVGLMLGSTQAGIYAAVLTTSELIGVFLKAGRSVAGPHVSRLAKHQDIPGLQRLMTLVARYAFVPSLLGFAVVAVFGRQILALFGSGFDAGYAALVVLGASQALKAVFGGPALLLLMSGRQVTVAKVYVVAVAIDLTAQVGLIYWLGMMGAAIASLVTVLVAQAIQTVIAAREIGVVTSAIALPRSGR